MSSAFRSLLLALALSPLACPQAQAQNAVTRSLFDPDLYTPLNGGVDLVMNSGDTLAIDTSALTITRNGVSLGTGVVGNTAGPSPQPVALFTFTSLTIPSGVTVTITGSRPLGLLARRNMTIGCTLDLSGAAGAATVLSNGSIAGAAGKLGGFSGGSSSGLNGTAGSGPGAGGGAGGEYSGGGGGGHAATGESGDIISGVGPAGAGGSSYSSAAVLDLHGGSGGGGGGGDYISFGTDETGGSGGAGGGGLVLIAQQQLTLTSSAWLSVQGGTGGNGNGNDYDGGGGGGSGGSLVCAAPNLNISQGASLNAQGGYGGWANYWYQTGNTGPPNYYPLYGYASCDGGDGSGGRVAIYSLSASLGGSIGAGSTYSNGNAEPSFVYPAALTIPATPVPGELDSSFSSDGFQTTAVTPQSQARNVVVQPDGKIVAIGFADNGSANYDFAVARYNADGSPDTSFGTGGKTTTPVFAAHDQAYAVALQSDGKIVVGGWTDSGTNADFALVRYNTDGSLDNGLAGDLTPGDTFGTSGKVTTTFNLGGDNRDDIRAIAIQSDGKIVVSGFAATASNRDVALARYNSNGSLDTSFDGDGKLTFAVGTFNDYGLAMTLQADGKILVGGSTYVSGTNTASVFVARLLPSNGAFDPLFGTNGKVTTAILAHADGNSLTVQPDGKIILGGLADNTGNSGSGATADFVLLRLNSNGVPDTTFTGDGVQAYDFGTAANSISAVRVQADGKIVAVGPTRQGSYDAMGILRVNADGSPDTTFDGDGKVILDPGPQDDALYGLDFDANGNIVAAGLSETSGGVAQFAVVRLLGQPRPGVWNLTAAQVGGGTGGMTVSGLVQSGSAISGASASLEYGTSPALGSSVSLGTLGVSSGSATFSATIYPGGLTAGTTYYYRVVATNEFGTTTSATQTFVYAPGGVDYTFASGGVQTNLGIGASQGRAVAMQSDGKIVVAGFTNNGTKNVPALVRYLSTGALDTTFGTGGVATMPLDGTNEQLYAVAIQSDGKIVAAGAAVRGGDFDMVLTRWTSTGQPDTSFEGDGVAITGYGANQDLWQAVHILPNGQILVAGYTQSSTTADYVLARYNSDGTLDATFDGDSGTANGRVVTSIGVVDGAAAMAVQPDGKIILAGDCDSSIGLIRFTSGGLIDTSFGTSGKIIVSVGVSTAIARSLALQPDGKIVAACTYFSAANDSNGLLMRFNPNGSNDNTFDGDGRRGYGITSLNDSFHSVTIQPDGRIVAVGRSGNSGAVWGDMVILRANPDGTEDTTFDGDGILTLAPGPVNDHLYGVTQDASGNIVAAGLSDTSSGLAQFAVVRVLAFPQNTLIKNPSFESVENFGGGIVTGFNDWGWDIASSVTAENGITPYAGSRMLKFISTHPTASVAVSPWCDVPQYVDLSAYAPQVSLGLVSATATARFNRVAGNANTDTRFDVIIEAHSGAIGSPIMAQNDVEFISDANPATWELITNNYNIPTGTTHLLVGVYAYENVSNQTTTGTEFDGHYADDVQLTITVAPFAPTFTSASSIGVTSAAPVLTGQSLGTITLGYAPTPGDSLMLIKNTGLGFITGQFSNLTQGQTVTLSYGGVSYNFVANYYGGTGNDLVLVWKDTKAWAWGANGSGQIGDGSTTNTSPFGKLAPTSTSTTGGLAGKTVIATSAGNSHSLALCSDGTVTAWGSNSSGKLGNNSTTSSSIPVAVDTTGVLSGKTVIAVAAGSVHSLALCSDGSVAAWGLNDFGQLGNNSTTTSTVPVAVNTSGLLSGKTVVAIAAGERFSLALCSDGSVAAWGYNHRGQLGNNSTTSSSVPVAVNTSGVLAGKTVVAIDATTSSPSDVHSLAVCSDGTVAAWGANSSGQLGNNSTVQSNVPVLVTTSGVLAGKTVVAASAGGAHSIALCSDGTVAAWGANEIGQLGNNGSGNSSVPVLVNTVGVLSGKTIIAISAGYAHSLALCSDGTSATWGYNANGQLGNNSTTSSSVPVTVSTTSLATGQRFVKVHGGSSTDHNLALVASPPAPAVTSLAATNITTTGASLNGTVNAVGGSASVTFEYGLTSNYGSTAAATPSPATGTTATNVSTTLTGLLPGTTYHYRLIATSAGGTTTSEDGTFTTLDPGFWYVQMFEDHTNFPSVATLSAADALIASGARIAQGTAAQADLYGTSSTNPAGRFPFDYPLPGYTGNHNDYAVKATARFVVTTPGDYTFAANTDDGVRVKIDGTTIIADDGLQAQVDSPYVVVNLTAGTHRIEWVWFEHLGQDVGEVFAAPGVHTSFNSNFKLVGDPTLFGLPAGSPEIALDQTPGGGLMNGSAISNFGSASVGISTDRTYTVQNIGTADLTDLSLVLTGAGAASFSVIAPPAAPVVPGGNTSFTVRFVRSVVGQSTATLRLTSNDADEGSFEVSLTGTGLSTNADLSTLSVAAGSGPGGTILPLTPVFSPAVPNYTVNVPLGTSAVTLTGLTADLGARITSPTSAFGSFTTLNYTHSLSVGAMPVNIQIMAEDGFTFKTYTVAFHIMTAYETWSASYNGGNPTAGSADDDGDGVSNLTEFAFGTVPNLNVSGPGTIEVVNGVITRHGTPTVRTTNITNGVDFRALFGRRKDHASVGLTFTVQFSADLVTWQSSTATPTVIADDGEVEACTVPYPFFINGKKARFFRVVVTGP